MAVQTLSIHNLPPQPTPFVGRESEIDEIINRLREKNCRLLTLVGPGGIGKTRLAIESIQHLIKADFEHGIFYVPLAPLKSADNVVTTTINVLGIHIRDQEKPKDALIQFLTQRHLLLVMDNFEHVLTGIAIVTEILNHAPHVKILVTSRETLNLSMEYLWHVRGMRYPASQEPEDINQYDALNLFIERALQIRRDFSPGDEQVYVIEICQLVNGLPLAIELAVSWLKTLSCQDIINQIEHGIDFLTSRHRDMPERHHSIRAVFDHSWNLLTSDEQLVFPRLAVFRGGFTLQAAEQVAGADLITLSGLAEKSMIRRDATGRYDIHELLRQYGEEFLVVHDDLNKATEAHLSYFANFISARVPDLQGRRQIESLNEVRADFENVRTAWQYASQQGSHDKLDRMLEGVGLFFELLRYPPIAHEMYRFALAHVDAASEHTQGNFRYRLQIFSLFVYFRSRILRYDKQVADEIDTCLHIAEENDDQLIVLICLIMRTLSQRDSQYRPDANRLIEAAEGLGSYYLGWVFDQLCYYYTILLNENSERTLEYLHQYLEITQSINDVNGIATAYSHLAQHNRFWGDIDTAIDYFKQAVVRFRQIGNMQAISVFSALVIFMKLKQGEFDDVRQKLPYWIAQLTNLGFFTNHSYVYMTIAKAEALSANYERCKAFIKDARSAPTDIRPRTAFHIYEAEAMYAIGIGNFESARDSIIQALQVDTSVIANRLIIDLLPLIAFLYHHDQQPITAVELLGLAFNHPLATTGWMEKWELLSQLRQALQQELGEEHYHHLWERGSQLDLDEVIANIRKYMGLDPAIETSTQALVEPLTERELEVLELLGEGLSNREIATRLIIARGTVKAHVHNICQKLAVKNRTQAVLKAKKLRLL